MVSFEQTQVYETHAFCSARSPSQVNATFMICEAWMWASQVAKLTLRLAQWVDSSLTASIVSFSNFLAATIENLFESLTLSQKCRKRGKKLKSCQGFKTFLHSCFLKKNHVLNGCHTGAHVDLVRLWFCVYVCVCVCVCNWNWPRSIESVYEGLMTHCRMSQC